MAKLRRNYSSGKSEVKGMVRMAIFSLILLAMLYFGYDALMQSSASNQRTKITLKTAEGAIGSDDQSIPENDQIQAIFKSKPWLPQSTTGEIVDHIHYTLSYNEQYEQAEWVAYPLTQALLRMPNVPRTDYFFDDPKVSSGSATYYDYKGSGYTKGHLAPAADMAFDTLAMRESFYMSNMSPQLRAFNNGIWRELEEQTRDWAYHNKEVYLVSGPVLSKGLTFTKKKIGIPQYFYKIILDIEDPEKKAIAFLIPHATSDQRLSDYAVSIDEVEAQTGIDFFPNLLDDDLEEKLESSFDVSKWKFSEERYKLRISRWNVQ